MPLTNLIVLDQEALRKSKNPIIQQMMETDFVLPPLDINRVVEQILNDANRDIILSGERIPEEYRNREKIKDYVITKLGQTLAEALFKSYDQGPSYPVNNALTIAAMDFDSMYAISVLQSHSKKNIFVKANQLYYEFESSKIVLINEKILPGYYKSTCVYDPEKMAFVLIKIEISTEQMHEMIMENVFTGLESESKKTSLFGEMHKKLEDINSPIIPDLTQTSDQNAKKRNRSFSIKHETQLPSNLFSATSEKSAIQKGSSIAFGSGLFYPVEAKSKSHAKEKVSSTLVFDSGTNMNLLNSQFDKVLNYLELKLVTRYEKLRRKLTIGLDPDTLRHKLSLVYDIHRHIKQLLLLKNQSPISLEVIKNTLINAAIANNALQDARQVFTQKIAKKLHLLDIARSTSSKEIIAWDLTHPRQDIEFPSETRTAGKLGKYLAQAWLEVKKIKPSTELSVSNSQFNTLES